MRFFLILALAAGCLSAAAAVPTVPTKLPAGIFLDPDSRATLPAGTPMRLVSEQGLRVTKESEGWRARLYNDVAGYCTIGYGHLIKKARCDGSESAEFRSGITEPRGSDLLRDDMAAAQVAVMLAVTVDLTDPQYAALCDFVFNVGATNFRKSTLLKKINAKEFEQVPAQLRRWTVAGGKEVQGLANRREKEIRLFFQGQLVPRAAPAQGDSTAPVDIRKGEAE